MEEIIAVVNEKDEVIDAKQISYIHKAGLLHRESYVYLINFNNEVLLQKRKDNGLWDHSAAGHFSNTESYIEGAKREFEEELGVKIETIDLKEIGYERINTIKPDKKNFRFVKIYIVKKDIPLENFKIDHTEVDEIKFFDKSELRKLLQQPHLLTGSAKSLIEKYILSRL
jgi:isopentenyldiphosphate isomerase